MDHWFGFGITTFSAVFLAVDPFAAVPLFLAMTAGDSVEHRRRTAAKATWTVALTLGAFAVAGGAIFRIFGVSIGAFRVAGGALLFLMAIDMLRARTSSTRTSDAEIAEGVDKAEVGIVPLGIPMLAGPGSIATVTVLMSAARESIVHQAFVLACVASTAAITYAVLRGAVWLERTLKTTGLNVLNRLLGLILAAVAVQFVAGGIQELFPGLAAPPPRERGVALGQG